MQIKKVKDKFKTIEPFIKNRRILDIGCVDARSDGSIKYETSGLYLFLREHASEIVGIDIDEKGIEKMKQAGHNAIVADAENMNLGMKFDCVVAGEIIEHLSNPGLFLESIKRHLVDDGYAIITTPNAFGIRNFFRILHSNRIKVHDEHTCWFDPKTITQLLRRHSFSVEKIFLCNRRKIYMLKYLHKMKYQIPRFFSFLRPYYAGTVIVIAKKLNP